MIMLAENKSKMLWWIKYFHSKYPPLGPLPKREGELWRGVTAQPPNPGEHLNPRIRR